MQKVHMINITDARKCPEVPAPIMLSSQSDELRATEAEHARVWTTKSWLYSLINTHGALFDWAWCDLCVPPVSKATQTVMDSQRISRHVCKKYSSHLVSWPSKEGRRHLDPWR